MSATDVAPLLLNYPDAIVLRGNMILSARGVEFQKSELQTAIAKMLGVDRWVDLFDKRGNVRHITVVLDESMSVPALTLRLRDQADILEKALGISTAIACEVVAELRATAHPHGPHSFNGQSAVSIERGKLEYRGIHPDDGPLTYRDGVLGPLAYNWRGYINLRENRLRQLTTGLTSVLGSINEKIILEPEDDYTNLRDAIISEGADAINSATDGIGNFVLPDAMLVGSTFRPRLEFPAV